MAYYLLYIRKTDSIIGFCFDGSLLTDTLAYWNLVLKL